MARVRMCITCWKPARECICDDGPDEPEPDGGEDEDAA
jgi:hypothetical protein